MIKINWGTRIFLLYTVFVLFIGVLVWRTFRTPPDLVTENYYEQELSFQQKLDAQRLAAALPAQPEASFAGGELKVAFPEAFRGQDIKADVLLYNRTGSSADEFFPEQHTTTGELRLRLQHVPQSTSQVQLSWQAGGKAYYSEIFVTHQALSLK